ncbi:MAG: hypothetical protein WED34_17815 [Planctomycetales bacterium]
MTTSVEAPAQRYVDFDEFVDFQLHKTESAIKMVDLLTAAVGVGAVVVGYLLAFVVLDHWVVPGGFGFTARVAMLGGVALATVAWVAWKVVLPATRRVNTLYAARTIERSDPAAKSTLLNLVDLRRAGRPVPPQILGTLEKRAALMLSHMDVEQAVDRRLLMRLAYALLIVVVGFCLYTLFSPKKVSNSIWRALLPAAQVEVATRTEIVDVQPGDVEVLAGTQLEVLADLSGRTPERVTLYFTTADRRTVDETIEMRPVEEGVARYRALLVGEAGRGIRQNMTYRIEAGDGRSDEYRVAVLQPPSAAVTRVAYDYPAYMGLAPRASEDPRIEAWEGTRVTLAATTNVPVEKAWIEFSDDERFTHRGEELRFQEVSGTSLRHEWALELRPIDMQPRSPRFYRIQVQTPKGERDPSPIVHPFHVRPDGPPELRIVEPQLEELASAAQGTVPLVAEARDDFAIRSVSLRLRHDGKELPLDRALARHGKTDHYAHVLEIEKLPLDLRPGDVLEYRFEARDNKPELGQATFSEWRRIRITEEQLTPERQQQQRDEVRRRQQERLDEARRDAGDGDQAGNEAQAEGGRAAGDPEADQRPEQPGAEGGDPAQGREGDPGDRREPNAGAADVKPQAGANGARQDGEQPRPGAPPQDGDPAGQESAADEGASRQPAPLQPGGQEDDRAVARAFDHLRDQERRKDPATADGRPEPEPAAQDRDAPGGVKPGPPDARQPNAGDPSAAPVKQPGDGPSPATDRGGESPPGAEPGAEPGAASDAGAPKDGQPSPGRAANSGDEPEGTGSNQAPPEGAAGPGNEAQGEPTQPPGGAGGADAPQPKSENVDPPNRSGGGEKDPEGGTQPAASDEGATPGTASGNEQGPATPGGDPEADPVQAKKPLQRQGDEAPEFRPNHGDDQRPPADTRQGTGAPGPNEDVRTKSGTREAGAEPSNNNEPPADSGATDPVGRRPREGAPTGDGPTSPEGSADSGKPGTPRGAEAESDSGQQRPGQPGEQPGAPKQGDPGAGAKPQAGTADGVPQRGQPGAGEPSDREGTPGATTVARGGSPAGHDREGPVGGGSGGVPGADAGDPPAGAGPPSRPDEANLEYNRKAAELVLQRLEEQLARGEVDEELKKKLGWSDEQIRNFIERRKPLLADESPDDSPELRRQRVRFEEMLRGLDLKSTAERRTGEGVRRRDTEGFAPRQAVPAPEYRQAYEEYLRRINQGAEPGR